MWRVKLLKSHLPIFQRLLSYNNRLVIFIVEIIYKTYIFILEYFQKLREVKKRLKCTGNYTDNIIAYIYQF